jgi:hypothetical protein
MLDPLTTAEIQALRLKLQLFASRGATQLFDLNASPLTRSLRQSSKETLILRQVLANSVEQLEEALRRAARSTIEKATMQFLTGLRRRGSLSA